MSKEPAKASAKPSADQLRAIIKVLRENGATISVAAAIIAERALVEGD